VIAAHVAAQVADLVKARLPRDDAEPGKDRKVKRESRLDKAVRAYQARLASRVENKLGAIQKAAKDYQDFDDEDLQDDEFESELILILADAAKDGAKLAGEQAKIAIDYTLTNKHASAWVQKYVSQFMRDLDKATLANINAAVQAFIETPGLTIGDAMAMMDLADPARAQMIATTEITRAYAQGNLNYGDELQAQFPDVAVTKTWNTNNDDRVCDICGDVDGDEIEQDEKFDNGCDAPPAHPNCRCWISVGTRI
jgi:hypothetical protein